MGDKREAEREREMKHLTQREQQIVKLVVKGKTQKEIASLLDLSVNTIRSHLVSVKNKLQVHKNTEVVRMAIEHKLYV